MTAWPRFLVAPGDGDFGAFPGEENGRGFADAGSASGDESDLVFKAHKKYAMRPGRPRPGGRGERGSWPPGCET